MSIHALKRFFIVVWCVRLQLAINTRQFFMHIIIERIFFTYWNALWNVLYKLNGLMYLWWSLKWCRNFKTKKEEANEIVLDFFLYPLYIYFCGLQSKYVNGLSDGNWEKEGAWVSEWGRKVNLRIDLLASLRHFFFSLSTVCWLNIEWERGLIACFR